MPVDTRKIISKVKRGRGYEYVLECKHCKKHFKKMGKLYNRGEGAYCSVSCSNKGELKNLKGGTCKLKGGYIGIKTMDDRADCNGYYFEHRLVVEAFLGRALNRDEIVHHKNGRPADNRLENLEVMSREEHCNIHNPKTGRTVHCAHCNKLIYKNNYLINKFANLYCGTVCYLAHRWGFGKQ